MGRRIKEGGEDTPKAKAAPAQGESFSVEKKIAEIKASNLPEAEKEAYIRRLTGDVSTGDGNRVPFTVYANIKKIGREKRAGMLATPKAKATSVATLGEWDEIFKDF